MTHLFTILVVSAALQQATPAPRTSWPDAVAASATSLSSSYSQKLYQSIRSFKLPALDSPATSPQQLGPIRPNLPGAREGSGAAITPTTGSNSVSAPPEQVARIEAFFNSLNKSVRGANDLADGGNLPAARTALEKLLQEHLLEFIADALIDVEFREEDYASAYQVAAPFLRAGIRTEPILVRASLAAACVGEFYPGQLDFCLSHVREPNQDPEIAALIPTDNSLRTVRALSHVLYANEFLVHGRVAPALPHAEAALQLDPTNPWLSVMAADCELNASEYSTAVKNLEGALPRSGHGTLHERVEHLLRAGRYDLATWGDGKGPVADAALDQRTHSPVVAPRLGRAAKSRLLACRLRVAGVKARKA